MENEKFFFEPKPICMNGIDLSSFVNGVYNSNYLIRRLALELDMNRKTFIRRLKAFQFTEKQILIMANHFRVSGKQDMTMAEILYREQRKIKGHEQNFNI